MPKAASTPITTRRALLAHVPALAVLTTAASGCIPTPAPAAEADAGLLQLCAEFHAAWGERERVWDRPAASHDEEMQIDKEAEVLSDRAYGLAERIVTTRAATDAGREAKVRVASVLAPRNADGTIHWQGDAEDMLWSVATDITGEPHVTAAATFGPVRAPAPVLPHPDAELIAICARHIANRDAYNRAGGQGDLDDDPLWAAYEETKFAIDAAEPRTLAGVLAKARAAKVEAQNPSGDEVFEDGPAGRWVADVVNDLLRLSAGGLA